jgi:TolA-binding protein
MRASRTVLFLLVGVALSFSIEPVQADEVNQLDRRLLELDARVRMLGTQLHVPVGAPEAELAERRLIDAQVLYQLKDYDAASMILLDVVEKYPRSHTYREALFYLADSLYRRKDYLSSRHYFENIVEMGPSNPRYQDALQRLIELSLHTGDYARMDGYITKLDAMPKAQQLPSVPYVKGKYFYFRRQFHRAIEELRTIGPEHVYYFHALYFCGAAHIAMGREHLDDAEQVFSTIVKANPTTDSQNYIVELAHLALGRIYLDREQLSAALSEYSKIGQRSRLFNDALYESAWVSIKGEDDLRAARALDLFLLNAPESPLVPEVRLLIGRLRLRQNLFQPATESFTQAREEYEPLQRQFDEVLGKIGDAPKYFRELIQKKIDRFDAAQVLSAMSFKWVTAEPEVQRTSTLIDNLADLKKSLSENQQLVERLEKAIAGPNRIKVFPDLASARARSVELSDELHDVKTALANRDAALFAPVAGTERALLTQLESERARLEQQLEQPSKKASSMTDEQEHLRATFIRLDKSVVEAQTVLNGLRAQHVATRKFFLDEVERRLSEAQTKAAQVELDRFARGLDGSQREADALRKDLADAIALVGFDAADSQPRTQWRAHYDELLRRLRGLGEIVDSRLSNADRHQVEQIEALLERLKTTEQVLIALDAQIDANLNARLEGVRAELEREKKHLATYQQQLAKCVNDTADTGGGIFAESFRKVAQRIYDVVLRADVGIIDVGWARKGASTREASRLTAERKRELKLLDDGFKEVLKEQP